MHFSGLSPLFLLFLHSNTPVFPRDIVRVNLLSSGFGLPLIFLKLRSLVIYYRSNVQTQQRVGNPLCKFAAF
ncbi:hypothetical protein B0H16DRAFT_1498575 [Mycena metata]|uniref:Uncharacterized protein n=1 Tax=Mycena metata TaxID=1033252 RepID=A0AAD7KEI1_9AGAR|nr:hypothetical protein B0H16DRAFT_1498575 [Mycena metata]